MALPHLITESQQKWLFKLTMSSSKWPARDLWRWFVVRRLPEVLDHDRIVPTVDR